jgi:hypothetical protein
VSILKLWIRSKECGPIEDAAMRGWSGGALKNIKFQALSLRVAGVGCQVSGKKNKKTEH